MRFLLVIVLLACAVAYVYGMYRLLAKVKKSKRKQFLKIQLVFTAILLVILSAIAFWQRERLAGWFARPSSPESQMDEGSAIPEKANRCACTWDSMRLKRDDYKTKHRPAAERLTGEAFIRDEVAMNELLAKGKLVPLKAPEGVRIQKLTHSEPFLHPKAAKTLDKLADRFREKISGTRESDAAVVVSSVTRTAKQQKEIQARYPNGATQGTSTHSYGASVDLLFVETAGDCYRARKALESTLNELQSEGDLYVCPESKCIHITAR